MRWISSVGQGVVINLLLQAQSFGGCFSLWVWRQKHEWVKGLGLLFHPSMSMSIKIDQQTHFPRFRKSWLAWERMFTFNLRPASPNSFAPALALQVQTWPSRWLLEDSLVWKCSGCKRVGIWKVSTMEKLTLFFETVASKCEMAIPTWTFYL